MNTLIYLIGFTLAVVFHSLRDGLHDANKKVSSHMFSTLHVLTWLLIGFITSEFNLHFSLWFILLYVLIRFSLFDSIRNVVNKLPVFFVGTTSNYDKFWQKIKSWGIPLNHLLFWLKFISLLIALSFLTYNF